MDIRVLQYFVTIAREGNFSAAAEKLHMTQPPLSRMIKDLEDELGKKLLIRGNRKITLTDEGIILRKRAEEMIEFMEKTKSEISSLNKDISGDIYIGGAETDGIRFIAKIIKKLCTEYPNIHYHFFSGHAEEITDKLDNGLFDFGIFIEPADMRNYDFIKLPVTDVWGLLMRKDDPLAEKETIKPSDLKKLPLIISNQAMVENEISGWSGKRYNKLNIIATYNLLYNAALMAEENIGYVVCIDKIAKTNQYDILCFRPFEPELRVGINIGWKKHQIFSKAAEKFISSLQQYITENKQDSKNLTDNTL